MSRVTRRLSPLASHAGLMVHMEVQVGAHAGHGCRARHALLVLLQFNGTRRDTGQRGVHVRCVARNDSSAGDRSKRIRISSDSFKRLIPIPLQIYLTNFFLLVDLATVDRIEGQLEMPKLKRLRAPRHAHITAKDSSKCSTAGAGGCESMQVACPTSSRKYLSS